MKIIDALGAGIGEFMTGVMALITCIMFGGTLCPRLRRCRHCRARSYCSSTARGVFRKLIAMRLGKPPAGYGHWTLQLLADEMVALEVVDSISHETVRKTLKKTA